MRLQLTLTFTIERGEPKPGPKAADQGSAWYQWYIPQVTDEQARILFKRKFGYVPAKVLRRAGVVMAGPIRENGRG